MAKRENKEVKDMDIIFVMPPLSHEEGVYLKLYSGKSKASRYCLSPFTGNQWR